MTHRNTNHDDSETVIQSGKGTVRRHAGKDGKGAVTNINTDPAANDLGAQYADENGDIHGDLNLG
ncbi:hypothetical protein LZ318_30855 [Saccharopolyspora indica]|uniref:hypothetical protein n=1 Tax=Saccharopolyspora indica TaxID=1229659 RepID=UPI0022EA95FE|nr:hypothetical protein [Saccharopolyspora indica]MDA3644367.1 hypothetical protein [Saccharopolyspora indica]